MSINKDTEAASIRRATVATTSRTVDPGEDLIRIQGAGLTLTLPDQNDPIASKRPIARYDWSFPTGASPSTIKAPAGNALNGVVGGSLTIPAYSRALVTWIDAAIGYLAVAVSGGGGTNPALSQATWFYDNANSSGVASDANDGLTAATPVVHYAEIVRRWGTTRPNHGAVSVTITAMSSPLDNSDPVIYNPIGSGRYRLVGALPAGTAGVLGVVTAANRTTRAGIQFATLPAAAAVGTYIRNHTRAESRSFVQRVLAAGAGFQLAQPYAALDLTNLPSTQNNAWTTGDAVTIYPALTAINLVEYAPTVVAAGALNENCASLELCALYNPGGLSPKTHLGENVQLFDVDITRAIGLDGPPSSSYLGSLVENCGIRSSFNGGPSGTGIEPSTGQQLIFVGGFVVSGASMNCNFAQLDGGFIVGDGDAYFQTGSLGEVAIDITGGLIVADEFWANGAAAWYSGSVIWGAGGTLDSRARLQYDVAKGPAATFPSITLKLNGKTTASSHTNATPDVLASGIALTVANLAAAAGPGGFGGTAFHLSGNSITDNVAP